MKKYLKENKTLIFFGFCIFIFTYVFFRNIHPLVLSNMDDWTYFAEYRRMIPLWGIWNPAKVFPEIFMNLCGTIAAYVITPITHDYVGSFSIISAVVVSIFITVYIYLFTKLLLHKYKFSYSVGCLLGFLFYLVHFLLFVNHDTNNTYLFYSHDVNCYYNYLIPNLLCFSFIFYILIHDEIDVSIKFPKNIPYGVLYLFVYYSIFSNLYCSIVLGVYAGVELIDQFFKKRKNFKLFQFLRDQFFYVTILIFWIISAIYEYFGERAQWTPGVTFFESVKRGIKNLLHVVRYDMNRLLLVVFLLVVIVFIIVRLFERKGKKKVAFDTSFYFKIYFSFIIITIYFILLSAKVDAQYMLRADCVFGLYVFALLFCFYCISYLFQKYSKLIFVLPFSIMFLVVEFNISYISLLEANVNYFNPNMLYQLDNDIVNQIVAAADAGEDIAEVHIPIFDSSDNWPFSVGMGNRFNTILNKHGIIRKDMEIQFIKDEEYNKKYHIELK